MNKWVGRILVCTFFFGAGMYCGKTLIMGAVKEITTEYRTPTKGEGFRSKRPTKEKYSEQTRRLR